jgi:hypothetical protein
MRPPLTAAQLEYLRTGETRDPDVYLDWAHPSDRELVRATFEATRGDYPVGTFPWAEEIFGGKRLVNL